MDRRTHFENLDTFAKLAAILLFFTITALVLVYRTINPLTLTLTEGYHAQIPFLYWFLVSTIILLLAIIKYLTNSALLSLLSTIVFFMVYSVYQFFFTHLFGGDINPISLHTVQENTHLSPDTHFSYLEFPLFWFTHRVLYLIPFDQVDMITGIERGFAVLIFLFSIAVWTFVSSNTRSPRYSFFGAAFFVAVSHIFWNFQYVPQFFAFVILVFLFSIHTRSGKRWMTLKLLLFTALVLSHPMFFIFYLASVFLYPVVKSAWHSFDAVESTEDASLIRSVARSLRAAPTYLRTFTSQLRHELTDLRWMVSALILFTVYLAAFLYRQLAWQTSLVISLQRSVGGHSAEFVTRFVPFISVDYGEETATEETPRELLYHLSSEQLSSFTTNATMLLILIGGLLLVFLLMIRDRRDISRFNMAILAVTGAYFAVGIIVNIHGTRALQVVFLPLILSLVVVKELANRERVLVATMIVIILLASPVAFANSINNAELVGGHSTGDYHTEQAGLWVDDHEWDTIVQPRRTIYPLDIHADRSHINIQTLTSDIEESNNVGQGALVQFDYRMYHNTQYRAHACNFAEQNAIYDNSNKILFVQDEFQCESTV